jgi:hypothetical protein
MKKVLFFALFPIFLGAVSVNAQVTIGKNEAPHPASVLDLRSTNKGLLLPRVDISDANTFQLSTGREDEAIGLTVYNTNNAMLNGQGAGIYAWSGSKWMIVSSDGNGPAVPVTNLTINFPTAALRADNSAASGNSVESGDTIRFSVDVQPGNATNPNCKWSVVPGGGTSSITPDGLFTAGSPGDVTVRATATDGSGLYGEIRVTVNPPTVPVTHVGIVFSEHKLSGGSTWQLETKIEPSYATNRKIIWSVESETTRGIVTVDQKGVVTATNVGSGTAVIRATSASNPSIFDTAHVHVYAIAVGPPGPGTVTGANGTYKTYCYPGTVGCWMIENSKEGTPSVTSYPGKTEGERGFYYDYNSAPSACPVGWILPLGSTERTLREYLAATETPEEHVNHWLGDSRAGAWFLKNDGAPWFHWGYLGWFAFEPSGEGYEGWFNVEMDSNHRYMAPNWLVGTVRCIKSK